MKTDVFNNDNTFLKAFLQDVEETKQTIFALGNYPSVPNAIKIFFDRTLLQKTTLNFISTQRGRNNDNLGFHLRKANIDKGYPQVRDFMVVTINENIMYFGYLNEKIFRLESKNQISLISDVYTNLDLLFNLLYYPQIDQYDEISIMLKYLAKSIAEKDFQSVELIKNQLESGLKYSRFRLFFQQVLTAIEKKDYDFSEQLIEEFLTQKNKLVSSQNFTEFIVQIHSKIFKNSVIYIENLVSLAEKKIFKYNVTYNLIIGSRIIKLMKVRIELLSKLVKQNPEFKAELEELKHQYNKTIHDTMNHTDKVYFLDEKQKKELKKYFKLAVKLCHPDIVELKYKEDAERVFKNLKNAFDRNNLEIVIKIYTALKKGIYTTEDITGSLGQHLELYMSYESIQEKYDEIMKNEVYQMIKDYDDYDEYFKDKLLEINSQILDYQKELKNLQ